MPIPIQPAPALLVGLGARILLDLLNHHPEEPASLKNHILLGVWQGVALHYTVKNSSFGYLVLAAIAGKLLIEFNIYPDINKCAVTVVGVVLGFLGTDLITQFTDSTFVRPSSSPHERRRRKVSFSTPPVREDKKRQRTRATPQGGKGESGRYPQYHPVSDITSVDSDSDLLRTKENMTPLEREIAALRARASLADSERRRYREERKWAISEGNMDRAAQLKQQVKRYTALMQGFQHEADDKMIKAVQNGSIANGNLSSSQRASTAPPQQRPQRVLKSGLSNGHNNQQPSSSTWEERPGPSRRIVSGNGSAAPAPIIIRQR